MELSSSLSLRQTTGFYIYRERSLNPEPSTDEHTLSIHARRPKVIGGQEVCRLQAVYRACKGIKGFCGGKTRASASPRKSQQKDPEKRETPINHYSGMQGWDGSLLFGLWNAGGRDGFKDTNLQLCMTYDEEKIEREIKQKTKILANNYQHVFECSVGHLSKMNCWSE